MTTTPDDIFGEPISVYSRAQAIEDGVLIDVMQEPLGDMVRQASIRLPLAFTREAWAMVVHPIDGNLPRGQDLKGRLWDVLTMLRHAIRNADGGGSILRFDVLVNTGRRRQRVRLKVVMGADDDGGWALTIMLPEQD